MPRNLKKQELQDKSHLVKQSADPNNTTKSKVKNNEHLTDRKQTDDAAISYSRTKRQTNLATKSKDEPLAPTALQHVGKQKSVGSREEVWSGAACRTGYGLTKDDLMISKKNGKIISKKMHQHGIERFGNLRDNKISKHILEELEAAS